MSYVLEKKSSPKPRNARNLTLPPSIWTAHDEVFAAFRQLGADMKEGDLIAAALVQFLDQPMDVQIKLIQRGRAFDLERLQKLEQARDEARAEKDFAAIEATERAGQRKRKTPA